MRTVSRQGMYLIEGFINIIDTQPTAFNVNKVVAEIKKAPTDDGLVVCNGEPMILKSKAIKIVRNGRVK